MAPLPAVAKVVRVDHHFSQGGNSNIQFREFYAYSGALSLADATTWLTNITTGMTANLLVVLSNTLTLTGQQLTDLTSVTSPQVQNATGGAGGNVNPENPAGVAMIMRKRILRRYRGGHPRAYIPGTVQAWLSNPTLWNPTFTSLVLTNYNLYISAAIANTNPAAIGVITHVNVSYFKGFENVTSGSGRCHPVPTPRATPVVDAIASVVPNTAPATQRRRNVTP